MKRSTQSGQVLVTGIVMMCILLLIILYAFDVHNVIRAKLKVDVAQQSAAMTGAAWQKESLNLLGEINLLKASALLLEGSENWKTPLPDKEKDEAGWRREMQSRIDLLTEMQTRVSFIGPLVGFAAAQQAAKSNGLNRIENAFGTYLELLRTDKRYDEAQGGAPRFINNYAWKEPYINLVSRINTSGIAVLPNARVAGMPITRPKQLADKNFYIEIMKTAYAIAENDPPRKHYWFLMNSLLRSMDDKDFQGKWWDISYEENRFPNESEIFTLGVEFGGDYTADTAVWSSILKPDLRIYPDFNALPGIMKWCIYDQWWMPEYYKNRYPEYETEHYNYWYGGNVLHNELKPEYLYEGPAAYTEGMADVTSVVSVRPSVRPYSNSIHKRDARESMRQRDNNILQKKKRTVSRVGSRRGSADDSNISTDYRPGAIAKVLGKLNEGKPPIELDLILPVFKQVSPVPTYMPIPYGFQVLKPGYSSLEKFLSWLAEQQDLNGTPPEGTEEYLEALRFLVNGVRARAAGQSGRVKTEVGTQISGRGLRYYGYNHKFNKGAFENEFKERLWEWYKVRSQRCFQQKALDGPGWLQEPALFSNEPKLEKIKVTEKTPSGGVITKEYFVLRRNGKIWQMDQKLHKVPIPDSINGGTAYRIYVNVAHNSSLYYVIDSRGQIVLNGAPDPTIFYNQYFPSGSGGNMNVWNPGGYDGSRGPTRL